MRQRQSDVAAQLVQFLFRMALKLRLLLQAGVHRRHQFFMGDWLGQIIIGPQLHAAAHVEFIRGTREKDKRDGGGRFVLAQRSEGAIPIEIGHVDITDDQVGKLFLRHLNPAHPILRRQGGKAVDIQGLGDDHADVRCVIDD